MSPGEVAGLALLAGLFGGVAGAVLVGVIISARRAWIAQRRKEQIDAYAGWLAARLTLSRACGLFVTAFRALAAEPRESVYFSLRMEEAQRARTQWCDAVRQLDLAEATLLAWAADPSVVQQCAPLDCIDAGALRQAINGTEGDADRLFQQLRRADRVAIDRARKATADIQARGSLRTWGAMLARTTAHLESIVSHWSARP